MENVIRITESYPAFSLSAEEAKNLSTRLAEYATMAERLKLRADHLKEEHSPIRILLNIRPTDPAARVTGVASFDLSIISNAATFSEVNKEAAAAAG
jgi:hypothetical protein